MKSNNYFRIISSTLLLCLIMSCSASAPVGTVKGLVVHRAGKLILGMKISLCEVIDKEAGKIEPTEFQAEANADGKFNFTGVPPGQYSIYIQTRARDGFFLTDENDECIIFNLTETSGMDLGPIWIKK